MIKSNDMRNIRLFENYSEFIESQASVSGTGEYVDDVAPGFVYIKANYPSTKFAYYNKESNVGPGPGPISSNYFTLEAIDSGTITWALQDLTVQYSKNGGSWETMNSGTSISVVSGDTVAFKATNSGYAWDMIIDGQPVDAPMPISSTAHINAKGNIMSLIYGDDFATAMTLTNWSNFLGLFSGCTTLVSAGELELPATGLTPACYSNMFEGCTSLTAAPSILPATYLQPYCYASMFQDCSGLTAGPDLPALYLIEGCYYRMFLSASSLNYLKAMFLTEPDPPYTDIWLGDTQASGTFVKNSSAAWTTRGAYSIPNGWTIEYASE